MVVVTDNIVNTTALELEAQPKAASVEAAAAEIPIGIITIEDVIEELMQTEISEWLERRL